MRLKGSGLTGTILFHALLLALLIFFGLTFPEPPPEEEGILVNFGIDETGFGELEPGGGEPELEETIIPREEVLPEQVPTEAYTPPPDPVTTDQVQDVEEVQVKEDPRPTEEELQRQREEEERIRQEQIQREREEAEQRAREEAERLRREEEARIKAEQERIAREQQEKQDRLNAAGQNAFNRPGQGSGDGSQGIAGGEGNQGDPNGQPGVDRYGTGSGLGNISDGLGKRGIRGSLPKPNVSGCEVTSRMVVRVDIQVDRDGNVVSATIGQATYSDKCIHDMVLDAAKRSKFKVDAGASFRQTGWIKYTILP